MNEKDFKELEIIIKAKDKDALTVFCKEREKELNEKGVFEKYLYYLLCYKIKSFNIQKK